MWYANKKPHYNKYRAQRVKTNDGDFASKLEYKEWCELKLLEQAGLIENLQRQVKIQLGRKVSYIADFVYYDKKRLMLVIHDSKGVETRDFRIKKEWLLEFFREFILIISTAKGQKEYKPYDDNFKTLINSVMQDYFIKKC